MTTAQDAPPRRRRFGAPRNWRDIFIAQLGATSNITAAADAAGISLSHVYKTRRADPAFARSWFEALAEGYDNLEMELLCRLRAGDDGEAAKGRFDTATAFRCLAAHRETVAREKGRRTLAAEVATIAAINEKIDSLRLNAQASERAVAEARKANRARRAGAGPRGAAAAGRAKAPPAAGTTSGGDHDR